MTIAELATTLAGFAGFFTVIVAAISWFFKRYVNSVVSDLTKDYLSELKPNSGSSMRDEVKGIRRDLNAVKLNVAKLEGRFSQHIDESSR